MAKINNFRWRSFLALEEELMRTQNFVEFHDDNRKTFSIKFRSIILQSCAEIDSIFKYICGFPQDARKKLKDYFNFFKNNHNDFPNTKIMLPAYNNKIIVPWKKWLKNEVPTFWEAHNQIKHNGNFHKATLRNAIHALAAYFSLLIVWYGKNNGKSFSAENAIAIPKLFSYPGLAADSLLLMSAHNVAVPGFDFEEASIERVAVSDGSCYG